MIRYEINPPLTADQFVAILRASTLAERRPVDDPEVVAGMVANANLTIVAMDGDQRIGVARSVTDFTYCCYLSDLAVDVAYQQRGIGRELMRVTCQQLGPKCNLILLAAPAAAAYYPRVGFSQHPSAWILRPGDEFK